MNTDDLLRRKCVPQHNALSPAEIAGYLPAVPNWSVQDDRLVRQFRFENYYGTLAFVNAIAYIAHAEDHHPELFVTYNTCTIKYDTHSAKGLSPNDFICAAKIDALFE
jgi:4a-hydroxytetrahydrobiopterin dehydratase